MELFRITLEKYASSLVASGFPARWNSKDVRVIYTTGSRSLACLENVVHRSALGMQSAFRTMVINLPPAVRITEISEDSLPKDWHLYKNYPVTQALGDEWIKKNETAVLIVPSAIIPRENNYLLNPAHEDFKKIKLIRTEPFEFDSRLKR